ncbi:hypothetical protein AB1Y20_001701 [Prymnesium parvum]|uniref:Uncharacterized protein n=1 Tax=Prymnesium parvum TaxID=97485 RepID=A0AB34K8Y5_PRYPA
MPLSTPASRRRKRLLLHGCLFGVAAATLLLGVLRPALTLSLLALAAVLFRCSGGARRGVYLSLALLLAAIPLVFTLGSLSHAAASPPAEPPPPAAQQLRREQRRVRVLWRRRFYLRLCLSVSLLAYVGLLFHRQLWRAFKRAVDVALPSASFGIIDHDAYLKSAEETTDRELDALRRHVQAHGAPRGLSQRASGRMRSFADGFMGITRSEALLWLVRATGRGAFGKEGQLNEGGFAIGADGRRIDPDDGSDGEEEEADALVEEEPGQFMPEDEATTSSSLCAARVELASPVGCDGGGTLTSVCVPAVRCSLKIRKRVFG